MNEFQNEPPNSVSRHDSEGGGGLMLRFKSQETEVVDQVRVIDVAYHHVLCNSLRIIWISPLISYLVPYSILDLRMQYGF